MALTYYYILDILVVKTRHRESGSESVRDLSKLRGKFQSMLVTITDRKIKWHIDLMFFYTVLMQCLFAERKKSHLDF